MRRRQDSDFAVRLKEKQRLRAQYGIRESQLHTHSKEEARRTVGLTGENLVELLEMRLSAPRPCALASPHHPAGSPVRRSPSHHR